MASYTLVFILPRKFPAEIKAMAKDILKDVVPSSGFKSVEDAETAGGVIIRMFHGGIGIKVKEVGGEVVSEAVRRDVGIDAILSGLRDMTGMVQ